jgi:WD40 repeat protein/transcriptional regulator with XRE-family HTH domain
VLSFSNTAEFALHGKEVHLSPSIPARMLEKFTTFGDLLRYLRRASGLTQLELSIQVGYSHAQISRLEQNLRLPDIPTIEARFVPALGLENETKVVARLLELAANVRREDAPSLGLCPYKGLNYFDESDADLFVGREALNARLVERVLSLALRHSFRSEDKLESQSVYSTRFLAVVGASGSGKSSLVRAGLVPALRWEQKSAYWHIQILTPAAHPLESLASSLMSESNSITATTNLMDDLGHDSRSLQIFAKRKLQSENQTHLLLVIDQFEELFTLCRSEEERASFISNLLTAASEANGPVSVLITLRADFYAHCANYIDLREALAKNQEYIGAMGDEELRRAIEEPARRGRWEFEPGLVDLLLHDVGREPGALPLLSHALFETWQRRRGRSMTFSGYASSGGVRGAIAETAETVFTDQFTREERVVARRIFLRLTELNDETSTADTRRRAKFSELILKPEEASVTHAVLKALADARLIVTSEDSAEVAHEALIREWPTLRGWLEENREDLRLHRQLTEVAQEWNAMEHSADILYRGARLAQVREWASTHRDEMNELECDFLNASIELSERETQAREEQRQRELEATRKLAESERQRAEEQTKSAQHLRKRAVYLTGAFGTALIMAFAAFFFGRQAQIASRLATSRELAAASITSLEVDPERSILLALEALQTRYTIEAEDALHRAIQTSRIQRVVQAHGPGATMLVSLSPDGKQFVTATTDGSVKTWDMGRGKQLLRFDGLYATYSPNGKQLAIVTPERIVRIINVETGKEIRLSNQVDAELTLAFSPDGSRLSTVASNNTPKVWDAKTGKELVAFPGHTDVVGSLTFSPDGTRLLTSSDDGTARVWDVITGEQLLNLTNHPGWVFAARYSPNGKLIVTVSGNEAYLWESDSGKRLFALTSHQNNIFAVAFSPDGKRLATGGLDRKIKVWDVTTGKELFTLSGHTGSIDELSFSVDGKQLISSSDDGTVRIWNVAANRELLTLAMEHSNGQVSFSVDGLRLAAIDGAGSLRIWDVHSGHELLTLPGAGDQVNDLAFSPDGQYVITAGEGAKLSVWDIFKNLEVASLSSHTGNVNALAITQDGKYLATASDDYKTKLWEYSSGKIGNAPLFTLDASGIVFFVSFNANGTKLATGNQDGTVSLWDTKTGKEIQILRGHSNSVTSISFSQDGRHIATASWDGTAKVWNVSTGEEEFSLHSHTGAVTSIAYNPDGTRIATASNDGTAKLWDAATGEELLTFFGDSSGLNDILFSPDGKLLATGGASGVRVYILQIDDLITLAKTRITRSLTSEECRKYLHRSTTACAPATSIATTTPMPPTENGRICQVTNTEGLYDHSFNEEIFKGLQDSTVQFGWDAKVLQSASTSDFEKNIKEFLRGDCDLIIGLPPMMDAIQVLAEANPNRKFMFADFPYDPPINNIWSQVYAVDQAAFLAGYVAASVTETGKVGLFGGIDIPPVTDFMHGFALGVNYYNTKNGTNVEVLGWDIQKQEGLFVGDFCCAAEGRQITQQLLDQGADVILPVAGTSAGTGALYAVKTHGDAFLIGVDTDWAITNPEYADIILTSIKKNYDVSVVRSVAAFVGGTFSGGEHVGTLETGEVSLAPFHEFDSLISGKVKADVEQIKKDIIAEDIKTKP